MLSFLENVATVNISTGNIWPNYNSKDNRLGFDEKGDREKGDIIVDITTSFVILIGIFFPSVTGESRALLYVKMFRNVNLLSCD